MSMSSRVEAIRPPDAKWKAMKAVWDSCAAAGVEIPTDVQNFFGDEPPDDMGVVIPIGRSYRNTGNHECVSMHRDDMEEGFVIDLDKLPKDVRYIRFVNSF